MGTRTSETLTEIEQLRSGLDGKLVELQRRLPPLARLARRGVAAAAGGGAGGGVLWLALRRAAKKRRSAAPEKAEPAMVVVQTFPKGALLVAAGAVAAWAAVRLVEARLRQGAPVEEQQEPAVVTPIERRRGV